MRKRLLRLLSAAGVENGPTAWQRTVMLRSSGALIHPHREDDRNIADRGFHLLVLSAAGEITHYCKCRPLRADGASHREIQVLEVFNNDADARFHVPASTSVRDDGIELQVTAYIDGDYIDRFCAQLNTEQRSNVVADVLNAAASLCRAALARPDTFSGPFENSPLIERAASSLSVLPRLGLADDVRSVLRDAFEETGSVPSIPQHGDLWPQNVLRSDSGQWYIIDLDAFGDVSVPLFDVCHLIRTTEDAVGATLKGNWIDFATGSTSAGVATRRIVKVESERWGLAPRQLAGCVLYYLLHIGVHIYLRGAPELFWGRFRDELPAATRLLQKAQSLDEFGARLIAV